MNERIQKLAQEAKEFADYYAMLSDAKEQDIFTEKFAELIIRECSNVCKRQGDQLAEDRPNKDFDEIAWYCQDAILDHFGIKE